MVANRSERATKVLIFTDKVALIRDAIRTHKQITGTCNRLPREFCPHLLGRGNSGWNVLGWKFAGHSEKGLPPEGAWRCFELEDLDNLATREGDWHRGFYSGRGEQHCVKVIDTAIDSEHAAQIHGSIGSRIRPRGTPRLTRKK